MIKKLKCGLTDIFNSRRVRMGIIAIILAVSVSAATLLGSPILTTEVFAENNLMTLNRRLLNKAFNSVAIAENEKAYPVYVTCGESTVTVDFVSGTVADALAKAALTADSDDLVQPSLDTVISDTAYIDLVKIDYVEGSYTEALAFKTETVYAADKNKGYSAVTQTGVNGEQQVFYTEKFVNGVSAEKTVTSVNVLSQPQNAVKVVGTKAQSTTPSADNKAISTLSPAFAIELDSNGNPVNYKYKKTVRATAYSHTGNRTSTGVWPQPGHIAVNPNIIPYGTKMYIKSPDGSIVYGYAVAADTGGFIKRYPQGIDLFMSTEAACTNFGVRNMEIYILE